MITWITPNVAIGEYADAINRELLEKEKIDCILCLRIDVSIKEEAIKNFLEIPLFHVSTGRRQGLEPIKIELRTAVYILEQLTKKYRRILVHCTAGIDRAPFVVALYLQCNKWGMNVRDIEESYKIIKEKRPQIIEHMEWV